MAARMLALDTRWPWIASLNDTERNALVEAVLTFVTGEVDQDGYAC